MWWEYIDIIASNIPQMKIAAVTQWTARFNIQRKPEKCCCLLRNLPFGLFDHKKIAGLFQDFSKISAKFLDFPGFFFKFLDFPGFFFKFLDFPGFFFKFQDFPGLVRTMWLYFVIECFFCLDSNVTTFRRVREKEHVHIILAIQLERNVTGNKSFAGISFREHGNHCYFEDTKFC